MYRRRAKLRDILQIVDRHHTGAMPRVKFHMCLELADLPVPDRASEEQMYGRFLTQDSFRYPDFLEALKYDESYQNMLTTRWAAAVPLQIHKPKRREPPQSFTPEPGVEGLSLPAIAKPNSRMLSHSLSRKSDKGPTKRLREALRSMDTGGRGCLSIEQLQQGLVALDLVPNGTNDQLLHLFRSCDQDGNGSIDYNMLVTKLQAQESQGKPLLVPGFRGSVARGPTRATPGSLVAAVKKRLQIKHVMLRESLIAADKTQSGKVALSTLKEVLKDLNIVNKEQLASGELEGYFTQFSKAGQVDYIRFADSVKAQDMAQLSLH